jgi:branched-chain amino acid transport system ATP-binding protein
MDELFDKITRIAAQGLAVLMVEQNAAGALEIADTGFVLVQGANRFTGAGQDLLNDPDTRRSFLGGRQ